MALDRAQLYLYRQSGLRYKVVSSVGRLLRGICGGFLGGRVAQLVRALLSHSRGPGFESLRDQSNRISLHSTNPMTSPKLSPPRFVAGLLALSGPAVAQKPAQPQPLPP